MSTDSDSNVHIDPDASAAEIRLPKNSFTAFRLKYCDSLELYNTSTVVFLGNIPTAWILDKKSTLLAKLNRLDNLNSVEKQHPEHSTLRKFETAANFTDTTLSNSISNTDIEHPHHSIKEKLISKLSHQANLHIKMDENDVNREHNDTLTRPPAGSAPLNSFLVNVSNHHHTLHDYLHDRLYPKSADGVLNSVHFNIPRESYQDNNMQFHLLMNDSLVHTDSEISGGSDSSSDTENSDDDIDNNSFTPSSSPIPHNSDTSSSNLYSTPQTLQPNTTSTLTRDNNTVTTVTAKDITSNPASPNKLLQLPESLRVFFDKPDDEKQEILKEEIDDAMISLQKNYTENSNRSDTDTDNDSFMTASETPLGALYKPKDASCDTQSHSETRERKSVTFDTLPPRVSFQIPASVSMNNATSMYTLQSKRLLLDKQTPFPYADENYDEYNDEAESLSKEINHGHNNITEAYTDIDDDVAETYRILKTKTLGAKLGISGEINKFEHKRKMKKLLQNFQAGEIIKMEKMLVMVSTIEKFNMNSDSKKSSRILERWREYITVVRATNDVDYPAIIQFFKSNKIFKKNDTGKLKREIYEEVLEKQRKEDEEEEVDEDKLAQEEKDVDDEDSENEESSQKHPNTIDQELDEFDEQNGTLIDRDRNSTIKSAISKFKNSKAEKITERKEKIEKLKKKLTDETDSAKKSNHKKDKNCHFSLVLSRHDVNVSFANLLDKSIRITKEKKSCTIIYTLLAHSTSSAIVWLSFLRQLLNLKPGTDRKEALLISIPSLDISFTITGVKTFYKTYMAEHAIMSDSVTVKYTQNGYVYPQIKTFTKMLDLIEKKVTDLEKFGKLPNDAMAREFLTRIKKDRSFLALSFRKYDRLEWILGESESLIQILWNIYASSYELELREFQHESHILSDRTQVEPLPIEGFVTKLSNRRGKLTSRIGRQYYKLLYAFTVENLLFFQNFYDAVPVLPDCDSQRHLISPAGDILNLKELEETATFEPTIYQYTPYPRTAHHIKWLKPGITPEEFADRDADALYEAERRACMISNAGSIVDLCKVTDIRLVPKDEINIIVRAACHATWKHPKRTENETTHEEDTLFRTLSRNTGINEEDEYTENCFELIMDNGSVMRIQVSTRTIRNEWAKNLSRLSEYWTLKKQEDLIRHVVLKEKNLKLMNTKNDDCYESLIANESEASCSKWELSKAYTDTQLYSISSYVLDKPVLMEGYLYCKKFKGKQFKLFYAVLSPGFFVVYDIFQRSKGTGVARNSTYYSRYAAISLASCYVFASTGKSNTDSKGQVFFSLSSGEDGLPRVYGDGWRSSESVYERSFTIWFGSKKTMMKNIKKKAGTRLSTETTRNSISSDRSESSSSLIIDENEPPPHFPEKKKKTHGFFDKFRKKKERKNSFPTDSREIVTDSSDESSGEEEPHRYEFPFQSDHDSDTESDSETSSFDNEFAKDIFRASKNDATEELSTSELLKSASRLGVTGRAIKFLARSRVDRDLWVTRLMTEVERFSGIRNDDIELV